MEPVPERIGRYQIERRLSGGAMGDVYLATDPIIGRRIVVKTVKKGLLQDAHRSDEFVARFRRECKLLGKVSHRNVVTMFDAGEDEATGTLFMAMEHVEGLDLQVILRGGTIFPPAQVRDIALGIARALEAAHRSGIVHRDLKPANVILSISGEVKLTDFGIAKAPGEEITERDAVVGTPLYLSPEQVKRQPLDGRSDLFSLGILLYQLLTGQRPFQALEGADPMTALLQDEPPPITSLAPSAPPDLVALVSRLLAKRPEDRPASASSVVRILEGEECAEEPPTLTMEAVARARGVPLVAMAAVASLLVLAMALAMTLLARTAYREIRERSFSSSPEAAAPPRAAPAPPTPGAAAPRAAPRAPSQAPYARPRLPEKPSGASAREREATFTEMEREYRQFVQSHGGEAPKGR